VASNAAGRGGRAMGAIWCYAGGVAMIPIERSVSLDLERERRLRGLLQRTGRGAHSNVILDRVADAARCV
jgi:hypothetical protein